MQFKDVIGQEEAKRRLIRGFNDGRLPHAMMFVGPEGCGNLAIALAFAQYIACPNRNEVDSCGTCATCRKFNNLQHADLHFSFPFLLQSDKIVTSDPYLPVWREELIASPYFTLDHWIQRLEAENKQLVMGVNEAASILSKLRLKSFEGGYKFMLIWRPELMNTEAANKLLKIIEEPPQGTLFMLVASSTQQMLPTILSRTQLFRLNALPTDLVSTELRNRLNINEEDANSLAFLTQGNVFDALRMAAANDDSAPAFDRFVEWMRICYSFDFKKLITWVDEAAKLGREEQKAFVIYALHMFRQCIVSNYTEGELALLGKKEADFSRKFAPFINHRNIIDLSVKAEEAHRDISRNVNARLVFFDLSSSVYKLLRIGREA